MKSPWWSGGGRDCGLTRGFQQESVDEGFTAEGLRGDNILIESCVTKPHVDYMVLLGDLYQLKADETVDNLKNARRARLFFFSCRFCHDGRQSCSKALGVCSAALGSNLDGLKRTNAHTLHYVLPSCCLWSSRKLSLIYPWPSNLACRGCNLIWSRGWLNVGNAGHAVI